MSILFTPDGPVKTDRHEEQWPPEFMLLLATFAEGLETTHLGIYCDRCKRPLQGQNAREDTCWRMDCACRTYVGRNPYPHSRVVQ